MGFKNFMFLYLNWGKVINITDNADLNIRGVTSEIMKTHKELSYRKVESFGFKNNELYVVIK